MIVRQKRYPKGVKHEVETRFAWSPDFQLILIDFGMILVSKIEQQSLKNKVGKQCKKKSCGKRENVNGGLAGVAGGAGKDPRGRVGKR